MRVLGRVERFRDRLQLEVRTLEPAEDVDPSAMSPAMRRDADELEGFLEFLVAELSHPGLNALVQRVLDKDTRAAMRVLPATIEGHHSYAGGLLEHTVGVATLCRETAQLHQRLRADLASGAWHARYGHLLAADALDLGYRLVVAQLPNRAVSP